MNDKDLKLIASFVASPIFGVFREVISGKIRIIQAEKVKRDTEFETIYQLGVQEGRQTELRELLKTLENHYRKFKK